jgi:transposase
MKAYSEDLRRKIVEAVEKGTSKSEAARAFGVGLSSVQRYVAMAREGKSLYPKKRPGSKPKLGEDARRLLKVDLVELTAATLPQRREFLRLVAGWRSATPQSLGCSSGWGGTKKHRWV